MQSHPLAELFPPMDDKSLTELANSIRHNGQREPIVIYQDKILDGRGRFQACELIGCVPAKVVFDGGDPLRFLIQQNLDRHNLSEGQRGVLAAKLVSLTQDSPIAGVPALTQEEAAELVNVSRGTVQAACAVLALGSKEQIELVQQGRLGVGVLARTLRKENRGELRKKMVERTGVNVQIWAALRDGINAITSLPLASDVVLIARTHDRSKMIERKLQRARQWLEDFEHAWNTRNGPHG